MMCSKLHVYIYVKHVYAVKPVFWIQSDSDLVLDPDPKRSDRHREPKLQDIFNVNVTPFFLHSRPLKLVLFCFKVEVKFFLKNSGPDPQHLGRHKKRLFYQKIKKQSHSGRRLHGTCRNSFLREKRLVTTTVSYTVRGTVN